MIWVCASNTVSFFSSPCLFHGDYGKKTHCFNVFSFVTSHIELIPDGFCDFSVLMGERWLLFLLWGSPVIACNIKFDKNRLLQNYVISIKLENLKKKIPKKNFQPCQMYGWNILLKILLYYAQLLLKSFCSYDSLVNKIN